MPTQSYRKAALFTVFAIALLRPGSSRAEWDAPFGPIDESAAKSTVLARENLDPVEGIWAMPDGSYQIAITKNQTGKYEGWSYLGIVVRTAKKGWKKGDLKMLLRGTASPGVFLISYFLGDKSEYGTTLLLKENGLVASFYLPVGRYGQSAEERLVKEWPGQAGVTASGSAPLVKYGTAFKVSPIHFVTAFHIVASADNVRIRIAEAGYPARIVSRDWANDLAVLEVTGTAEALQRIREIPQFAIGDPTRVRPGERVYTIGFPLVDELGARPRITEGLINATTGYWDDPRSFQISVPVQPGSSGGPLINSEGEVVGVVTGALRTLPQLLRSGTSPQNVNFAIKVNYVENLFNLTPALAVNLIRRQRPPVSVGAEAIMERLGPAVALVVVE